MGGYWVTCGVLRNVGVLLGNVWGRCWVTWGCWVTCGGGVGYHVYMGVLGTMWGRCWVTCGGVLGNMAGEMLGNMWWWGAGLHVGGGSG